MFFHKRAEAILLIFCVLFLLVIPSILINTFAQENTNWIPFIPGAQPSDQLQVLSKSADTIGLSVDSNFYGVFRLTTTINEETYDMLEMPGAGLTTTVGKPEVPCVTRFLEVPSEVNLGVSILYQDPRIIEDFNIIPAQEMNVDYENATEHPFVIDEQTYSTDSFYPSEIATIDGPSGADPIIIRGHRILPLNLYPIQFNPVKQQLRVYSKIEVRLDFDEPKQLDPYPNRLESEAFETLLKGVILNYQNRTVIPSQNWRLLAGESGYSPISNSELTVQEEWGTEYLIITHDDFYHQAQDLAEWKQKKGLRTTIVNTTQIEPTGPTAEDIADYIQNCYDSWSPAPSFVLLVGDSEFIPTNYVNAHPDTMHGGFETPTDLYYSTTEGTDYFPDIFIGRLSVDTAAQASTVINKIINYEKNPPNNADFYTHATACAQFQDNNFDGFEDRRFVLTSEEIRDFLIAEGYVVDRIYWADAFVNPTNYSLTYDNGDPIPADLEKANGFAWTGGAADITNSITAGRFLIYHRDHGASRNFWDHDSGSWGSNVDAWGSPHYETLDIAGLTNGALLPVVFSIECQCGWFDGEIDQLNDASLTRSSESFCEEFVRQPGGGAVAAIGSTRNSFSGTNDELARGFIDAIWPDFDANYKSGGLYNLGQVLTYGKIYMATKYNSRITFELFHLFGDPELAIWTEQPQQFDVSYPDLIGSEGWQQFVVNVTDQTTGSPVHHAKVCLQKDNEVYSVGYTDPSGGIYFTVIPDTGGEMNITVTKDNYRPYEDIIMVTSNGAVVTVAPTNGPAGITLNLQGSKFDGSENVNIYFDDVIVGSVTSGVSGSFTASYSLPSGPIGPFNIVAVGQGSGKRAVTVFRRLPDQTLPDPFIYSQWDSSTWHLNPSGGDPRWNNPDIQLFEKASMHAVSSNNLEVGTTYVVRATIHNYPAVDSTNTEVTFKWSVFGAGQHTWYVMGTDTITIPASGSGVAEVEWTPSVTGHSCITVEIYHPWDENLDNNKGQENTDVHPVSSPGEIDFTIHNPTENTALVYLVAKQVGGGNLWETRIHRTYPQVQGPGEDRNVTLFVEPPDGTQVGQKRIFTVSAYIDDELIGGIEVEVVKKIPTDITCLVMVPLELNPGDSVSVEGTISPSCVGATVLLTYKKPDGTTITRLATTDANSRYTDAYQLNENGLWTVKASWLGDSTHSRASSSVQNLQVGPTTIDVPPCWLILVLIVILIILAIVLTIRYGFNTRLLASIAVAIVVLLIIYLKFCLGWF